ncbi:RHS repeat-associated core domain-containing protein [Leifsonia sp. WHRI 6310E]|uniref:RHS repeat-associated core domain-containing protein n=1 Tax=Leifsonia sp. WHRI 6310E TaxID=3162562 RepID=UPI0032EEE04A
MFDNTSSAASFPTDFALSSYTYTFDPYGAANLTAGGTGNAAAQNPYLFKAGIQDRATGLVKFGLRWYNPVTGTWTQQDTLDAPLDPANANRYAFAGGDPINAGDPTGKISVGTVIDAIEALLAGRDVLDVLGAHSDTAGATALFSLACGLIAGAMGLSDKRCVGSGGFH